MGRSARFVDSYNAMIDSCRVANTPEPLDPELLDLSLLGLSLFDLFPNLNPGNTAQIYQTWNERKSVEEERREGQSRVKPNEMKCTHGHHGHKKEIGNISLPSCASAGAAMSQSHRFA